MARNREFTVNIALVHDGQPMLGGVYLPVPDRRCAGIVGQGAWVVERTMEGDTAAGHAVLAAAGGRVCDRAGRPLRYSKPGVENPHFIARGAVAGPPE